MATASGLPRVVCPACQVEMGLEAILGSDDARGVVALMARIPGPPALRKALLRYVGLFAPAKRQIGWGRVERLLGEVVEMLERGTIARNGQVYAAPLDYWAAALDTLFVLPGLRRPLKTHGLLLEIITGLASKADAKAESATQRGTRGETPIGRMPEWRSDAMPAEPAAAVPPYKPRSREAIAAGLQNLKDVLAGAAIPSHPNPTQGVIMAKKAKATAKPIAQSRAETAQLITALGDAQRERIRIKTEMDDQVAIIAQTYTDPLAALDAQIATHLDMIHGWCEAHRDELLGDGGKSANLTTGDVGWRRDPPSVTVRGEEAVLARLDELGLESWVRVIHEVAKDAILSDRAATLAVIHCDEEAEAAASATARIAKIAEIPGLSINAGREKFWVQPAELVADPA